MPSEIKPQSPRRSLLFVPGDSPRKIEKIRALKVDTVILDLEDSVAIKKKESARQLLYQSLQTTDFGDKDLLVRINASTTDFFQPDVDLIAQAKPAGLVIPKVDSAEILKIIDRQLGVVEHDRGWPSGEMRLLALIESALSIINIKQIAKSTARLDALLFGAEDLAADMNAVRSAAGWEVFYGRSAVATAAAAYGLQAIDTVFVDYQDLVGL